MRKALLLVLCACEIAVVVVVGGLAALVAVMRGS